MSTTAENLADPELLEAAWDLSELVDGDEENGVTRQLDAARDRATAFAAAHAGKVAALDAAGLADAMGDLAEINELVGKAGSFASLRFATDTADAARGALLQLVQERATEIETKLLFFELEWAALDDARAEQLLADAQVGFCAHYLRTARRYRPHLLSEPEETIMAEKTISAESAWARLFGELVAALRVPVDRQEVPLDVALSRLQDPRPRDAPRGGRSGLGHARARAADAGVHLQHAGLRQGRRGPVARLPALAGVAQSRQRGLG